MGEPDNDPYTTLGVDRTATKEQIKKAYYDLAKNLHPDAGGDHDSFLPVKLAYETLGDDAKRAFFDSYGVIPGSTEGNEIQAACQGLGALFLELLNQIKPEALKRLDVVGWMRQKIEAELHKNRQGLTALEQKETQYRETAEILVAKLKRSDHRRPDFFQQSVQAALNQCATQRLTVTASIAVQTRALELLNGYTFDFDKMPVFSGFTSTAFTTTGW